MFRQSDLQQLLNFESNGHSVLSLYLDADVGPATRDAIKLKAKSLLKEANGHPTADVTAIERYLEHEHDWSNKGLAIFACEPADLWEVYPTAVAFRDRIRVKPKPYVKPLAHLLDFYAHYGVILIDKVGARFFEYHLGELHETGGTAGEDVRQQKDGQGSSAHMRAGQSGAKQEQTQVQRNLRDAAEAAVEFFADKNIRRLFVGGTDENVSRFQEALPKQMRVLLAGTFNADMEASESDVREQTLRMLQEANQKREQQLVGDMVSAAAAGGTAVVGLEDTLKAVYEGRVQTLVISDGFRQKGYRYGESGYLSGHIVIDQPEAAGEPEEVADVVDEAANRTMAHGGHVEIISDNEQLEQTGRIGAILRY